MMISLLAPFSFFVGSLGSEALDKAINDVIAVETAFKGNPLEVNSVMGKELSNLVAVVRAELDQIKGSPQDPAEATFLEYFKAQVKNLEQYKAGLFWWSGLKWFLPLALDRIKGNQSYDTSRVIHRKEGLNIPGVNPKHLTPEAMEEYRKIFKEQKGMLYLEDFFDESTFARMQKEARRLWMSEEFEQNCNLDGKNRLGGYVLDPRTDNQNSFYNLIYGNFDLGKFVSELWGTQMFPADFPIELREYTTKSTGMPCHSDFPMFGVPKLDAEFLFTLFNNSTCATTFDKLDGTQGSVQSKANSLCFVRANDGTHCVKCKPSNGYREVMKWIYSGTYRKANQFASYAQNRCGATTNSKMMKKRREEWRAAEEASNKEEL